MDRDLSLYPQSGSAGAKENDSGIDVDAMSIKELKSLIKSAGLGFADCLEKADLKQRAREAKARLEAAS